jgi:WD40 repeat protein
LTVDSHQTLLGRLYHRIPLLGPWLARQAASALLCTPSPEAIETAALALGEITDPKTIQILRTGLARLTEPSARTDVARIWTQTRNPILTELLRGWNWLPERNGWVRVLVALLLDRTAEVIPWTEDEILDLLEVAARPAVVSRDPVLGARARQALEQIQHPEGLAVLAGAAVLDPASECSTEERGLALALLQQVADPVGGEAVAAVWLETRDAGLAALLREKRWTARWPPELRVQTALLVEEGLSLLDDAPEVVPLLLACATNQTPLPGTARSVLRRLRHPNAREAVCAAFLDEANPVAREAALAGGWEPADPVRRALFLFLTEQWPLYESLDFDGRLLQTAYETASAPLRRRLAEAARRGGRVELVGLLAGQQAERLARLSAQERSSVEEVLLQASRWAEVWRLAQRVPLRWGRSLVLRLAQTGWAPEAEEERGHFLDLVRFARACPEEPPLGRPHQLAPHQEDVVRLAFSPDGRWLASAGWDGRVRIYTVPTGGLHCTLPAFEAGAHALVWSHDTGRLLVAGASDPVQVWNLGYPEQPYLLPRTTRGSLRLALAADSSWVAGVGVSGRVWFCSFPPDSRFEFLTPGQNTLPVVLSSPVDNLLAIGDEQGMLSLHRPPQVEALARWSGGELAIRSLAFDPQGKCLYSGGRDGMVRCWGLDWHNERRCWECHDSVEHLACAAGPTLVAAERLRRICVWRGEEDTPHVFTVGAHSTGLALSADGRLLAAGGDDGVVRLWDLDECQLLAELPDHGSSFNPVALTADGMLLATGSSSGVVRLAGLELMRWAARSPDRLSHTDLKQAQQLLRDEGLGEPERAWLHYLVASLWWRHRHDVLLDEEPAVPPFGTADIAIEG